MLRAFKKRRLVERNAIVNSLLQGLTSDQVKKVNAQVEQAKEAQLIVLDDMRTLWDLEQMPWVPPDISLYDSPIWAGSDDDSDSEGEEELPEEALWSPGVDDSWGSPDDSSTVQAEACENSKGENAGPGPPTWRSDDDEEVPEEALWSPGVDDSWESLDDSSTVQPEASENSEEEDADPELPTWRSDDEEEEDDQQKEREDKQEAQGEAELSMPKFPANPMGSLHDVSITPLNTAATADASEWNPKLPSTNATSSASPWAVWERDVALQRISSIDMASERETGTIISTSLKSSAQNRGKDDEAPISLGGQDKSQSHDGRDSSHTPESERSNKDENADGRDKAPSKSEPQNPCMDGDKTRVLAEQILPFAVDKDEFDFKRTLAQGIQVWYERGERYKWMPAVWRIKRSPGRSSLRKVTLAEY